MTTSRRKQSPTHLGLQWLVLQAIQVLLPGDRHDVRHGVEGFSVQWTLAADRAHKPDINSEIVCAIQLQTQN